jgi:hypothetical protein
VPGTLRRRPVVRVRFGAPVDLAGRVTGCRVTPGGHRPDHGGDHP